MDEPFAGVDAATEQAIVALLQALRTSGKTVFVVHHELQTVRNYFDFVILLNLRPGCRGPDGHDLYQAESATDLWRPFDDPRRGRRGRAIGQGAAVITLSNTLLVMLGTSLLGA